MNGRELAGAALWRPPAAWPWGRRLFWIVLTFATLALLGPSFLAALRPRWDRHQVRDFLEEWASARYFWDGLPVYTEREAAVQRYLHPARSPGEAPLREGNGHPPPSLLLHVPLGLLDYSDAFLVWSLISLAALAVSLILLVRQLGLWLSPWALLPLLTLALWCNPLQHQMAQGQINLVLLLLLLAVWAFDRSGRPWCAGVCLGTATALRLFPAVLFLFFLLRRRWGVLVSGLVTFAVGTLLSAVVLGSAAYWDYATVAVPTVIEYRASWLNDSLNGFWHRLFDPGVRHVQAPVEPFVRLPAVAKAATLLSGVVVVALVAVGTLRARSQRAQDRAFGRTVTAMLLLSPVVWSHYFVLLLLPLALLWLDLPKAVLPRVLFALFVAVLWLPPAVLWYAGMGVGVADWMSHTAGPWQSLTTLSVPFYALLGLFLLDAATPPGQTAS